MIIHYLKYGLAGGVTDAEQRNEWSLNQKPPKICIQVSRGSILIITIRYWLGREDSNLRMRVPKTRVLPLDDAPVKCPDAAQGLGPGRLINVRLCRDI